MLGLAIVAIALGAWFVARGCGDTATATWTESPRIGLLPDGSFDFGPPDPSGPFTSEVLVVDGDSGAPVAHAEVLWHDITVFNPVRTKGRDYLTRMLLDPELRSRTYGQLTRTGADGRVRIVHPRRRIFVQAVHAGRYAAGRFDSDPAAPIGQYRLTLVADHSLEVRVLDAAGRPAVGAPVGLRGSDANGRAVRHWHVLSVPDAVDASAVVRLAHLQTLLADFSASRPQIVEWRVSIASPGLTDIGAPIDRNALPTEPIVLQLPPTGSIAVRTVVGDAVVVAKAWIGLAAAMPEPDDFVLDLDLDPPTDRPAEADGYARFDFVPLAREFAIRVQHGADTWRSVRGPTEAGEEVRVDVTFTADEVVVIGRLVDTNGDPLAEAELYVTFESNSFVAWTDVDGRFVWKLAGPIETPLESALLRIEPWTRETRVKPTGLRWERLERGIVELGDVRNGAKPVVVAGRLRGVTTRAASDIRLVVERREFRREPGSRTPRPSFATVYRLVEERNDAGGFRFTGDVESGTYRLRCVDASDETLASVEFTLGAQAVVVDLTR